MGAGGAFGGRGLAGSGQRGVGARRVVPGYGLSPDGWGSRREGLANL
jgi:hypothetical protein